jgi:hypothetical protein
MDCGLAQKSQELTPPAGKAIYANWVVTDSAGESISFHRILSEDEPFKILLSTIAAFIPGGKINAWVIDENSAYEYSTKFNDSLPGLQEGGTLGPCLINKSNLSDCFKDAGIDIPRSDPVIGNGQTSENLPNSDFLKCPIGFVEVAPGPNRFCAAKYEMKATTSGGVESVPANSPMLVASAAEAQSKCHTMGSGYALISNPQWMEMAREIERQPGNWSLGKVNLGFLNKGHSDAAPDSFLPADPADRDGCFLTNQICKVLGIFSDQRRTFILNNGQVIWDLAGNAAEIMDWSISKDKAKPESDLYNKWTSLNGAIASITMPDSQFKSSNTSLGTLQNIGGYYSGRTIADPAGAPTDKPLLEPGSVLRGGSKSELLNSGIYALAVDVDPSSADGQAGFRCAWLPVSASAP